MLATKSRSCGLLSHHVFLFTSYLLFAVSPSLPTSSSEVFIIIPTYARAMYAQVIVQFCAQVSHPGSVYLRVSPVWERRSPRELRKAGELSML